MSLYGPTFHITPLDLCVILYSNITNILYPVSCLLEIIFFQIVSNCFIIIVASFMFILMSFSEAQVLLGTKDNLFVILNLSKRCTCLIDLLTKSIQYAI